MNPLHRNVTNSIFFPSFAMSLSQDGFTCSKAAHLCVTCENVLQTFFQAIKTRRLMHHQSKGSLSQALKQDCYICSLIRISENLETVEPGTLTTLSDFETVCSFRVEGIGKSIIKLEIYSHESRMSSLNVSLGLPVAKFRLIPCFSE
jgi:hypothetical protein